MNILFVDTFHPYTTLEDESFSLLQSHFPEARSLRYSKKRSLWPIHQALYSQSIHIVIMRRWIPIMKSIPRWIFHPSHSLSFGKKYETIVQHFSSTKKHSLFLPPLLTDCPAATPGTAIVSYGNFSRHSNQHLVLDAYTLLPKRMKKKHPLILVGTCSDQDYLDRIHIHRYNTSVQVCFDLTQELLNQARLVIRMDDKSVRNSPLDRKIIESRRLVIYCKDSERKWIYPNGIACSPHDIRAVATQMKNLLNSPTHLQDLDAKERFTEYKKEIQKSCSQHVSLA